MRDLETEVRVTVLYGGIGEWRSLQDALTGASLVEAARLDAMSRDGALMTVNFRGAREQLISELAEKGPYWRNSRSWAGSSGWHSSPSKRI